MNVPLIRLAMLVFAAAPLLACETKEAVLRQVNGLAAVARADSMGALPTKVERIATHEPEDLVESSALVSSTMQPGILFTINDSGNDADLFALDTTGATRARWRIANARNRDWEAASRGPCIHHDTSSDSLLVSGHCLFIADVGDNSAARQSVTLYQITEPNVSAELLEGTDSARALSFRYPDHAHDVEAMYVAPDGTAYFITKRSLKDGAGKRRPALVFAIAPANWKQSDTVTAVLVDSVPIVPGSADQRQITDASLSHDARLLAVRTYGQVYIFATDSVSGRVRAAIPPAVCNVAAVEAKHGEGVTWLLGSRQLLLSNEGHNAPLHRITCPLPTM